MNTTARYPRETRLLAMQLCEQGMSPDEVAAQVRVPARTLSARRKSPAPQGQTQHSDRSGNGSGITPVPGAQVGPGLNFFAGRR